jgi:hypothetical protein
VAPPRRPVPRWLPVALGVLAGVIVGAIIGVATARLVSPGAADRASFADVVAGCEVDTQFAVVTDNTLTVNQKGGDDAEGASMDDVWCLVRDLDTPSKVEAHMRETTGDDGAQFEKWDDLSVSWTYHPSAGLDVVWTRGG